jgi:hypothetical protein
MLYWVRQNDKMNGSIRAFYIVGYAMRMCLEEQLWKSMFKPTACTHACVFAGIDKETNIVCDYLHHNGFPVLFHCCNLLRLESLITFTLWTFYEKLC